MGSLCFLFFCSNSKPGIGIILSKPLSLTSYLHITFSTSSLKSSDKGVKNTIRPFALLWQKKINMDHVVYNAKAGLGLKARPTVSCAL